MVLLSSTTHLESVPIGQTYSTTTSTSTSGRNQIGIGLERTTFVFQEACQDGLQLALQLTLLRRLPLVHL